MEAGEGAGEVLSLMASIIENKSLAIALYMSSVRKSLQIPIT